MSMKNLLLLIPFLYSTGYAETVKILTSNPITPQYNENLSGIYPSLNGNQFKDVNKSITEFIAINLDTKNEDYLTEVDFREIFKNSEIVSFSLNYNISNATERYFNKYYVVNLKKRKKLNLSEYLKQKNISKLEVVNSINKFIAPCHYDTRKSPEYCSDMALQNLLETNQKVKYSNISSFFINDKNIGLGIDSSKFTTTFIYNPKNKHISLD